MKDATKEILHTLSLKGYRITQARKSIISELAKQTQPISVQSLCAKLSSTDETSVYRTVRTLVEEGLLEEIAITGEVARYAIAHGHHHHVVCSQCGWTEHTKCEMQSISASLPKSFQHIESHEVTLFGLCKKCA